jgi:hypothetical protein
MAVVFTTDRAADKNTNEEYRNQMLASVRSPRLGAPEDLTHVVSLAGESETVEFKKTIGQLSRATEALCAFLNAHGGQVLFGVGPDSQALRRRSPW